MSIQQEINNSAVPFDFTNANDLDREIRPFPATATKIMALCRSNESQIAQIAELIECEPAVGVKLLSMANSPLFGATREINSVSHAVVLLGYNAVSQMALTIAAGPLFSSGDPVLYDQRTKLFRESLGCATVGRLMANRFNVADPAEAFLGGMMLDVGKLLFLDIVPQSYLEILENDPAGQTTQAEVKALGADHPTVGHRCGQKWGLPSPINRAIADHHRQLDEVESGLSRCVLAGSYFARQWSIGFEPQDSGDRRADIDSAFGNVEMQRLVDEAREQYRAVESIFFGS